MRRVRAGISALVLVVIVVSPASGALAAFAPHDLCMAQHHDCGRMPHIVQCCCRHSGSASGPQSGLMPSLHRDLSSHEAVTSAGIGSTAAVIADASPLAIPPWRAHPPNQTVLRI